MEIFAYNDNNYYVNFSNNTLGLSGGNANMTGHLTVNGTQDAVHINADTWGSLILQNSNIDVSTTPEANQYMGIDFRDKNNTRVGFFGARIGSDGNNYLEIQQQGVGGLNFPKCTTRATTTSTAKSWLPAVVVQNYVSGTSWYRVYSDNWCEQGGRFTSNDATSTTVTLMKAYRDTNYLPMICMYGLNGAAQYRTFQVQTINTNSMLVWNCTNGTNTCLWRCEGYI